VWVGRLAFGLFVFFCGVGEGGGGVMWVDGQEVKSNFSRCVCLHT